MTQYRAVSGPAPGTFAPTYSPPTPPSDIVPGKGKSDARPTERLVLRTSSMDSTISSNSSMVSAATTSQDPLSPNLLEIQQLIVSAGSPEALIRNLLKERQTANQQNTQLWRLINKQRHLIMGLNSDLAKAAEDRERYQKRYKELVNSVKMAPAQPIQQLRRSSLSIGSSPARSEDDLPIQRHSILQSPAGGENRRSASVGAEAKSTLKELQELGFVPAESVASSSNTSPSFSSDSKPRATPDSEGSEDGLDSRRNTIMQSHYKPISPIPPLEIKKVVPPLPSLQTLSGPPSALPPIPLQAETNVSPSSFTARRSQTAGKAVPSPVTGTAGSDVITSPLRKGPPARLNLNQKSASPKIARSAKSTEECAAGDNSDSDYDMEIDEIPAFERGRKKTREEDDREREYILAKQEESRSVSKQKKSTSKSGTPLATPGINSTSLAPKSPAIHGFSPGGSPSLAPSFSPHASLDGLLTAGSTSDRSVTLSLPPVSPGLPRSPRPGDRPQNSPQPRAPLENTLQAPWQLRASTVGPGAPSPALQRSSTQSILSQIPAPTPSPSLPQPKTMQMMSGQRSPALRSPALQPQSRATTPVDSAEVVPSASVNLSPKSATEAAFVEELTQSPIHTSIKSPAQVSVKSPIKEATISSTVPESLTKVPSNSSSVAGGIYRGLVSEGYPDLLLPPNALPSISVKVTSSRMRPSRHSILSLKSIEDEPVFTLGVIARSNLKQLWRVEKSIQALPQLDQQLKQACLFEVRPPDRSLFAGHAPAKIDARRDALEKYFEDILDTPMNEKAGLIMCQFLSSQAIPAEEYDAVLKSGSTTDPQQPIHLGPDGNIIKEGFLTKRGKNFGGWKARYFVLDDPILRYYESPGGQLLGQIKLTNAQIGRQSAQSTAAATSPTRTNEENEKEFRHAFLILEPKKKDSNSMLRHVLCAENDSERDGWVNALLQYVGQPSQDSKAKTPRKTLTGRNKNKDDSPTSTLNQDDPNSLQSVSYENTVAGQPVRIGGPPPLNTASPVINSFSHISTQMQTAPKVNLIGASPISGPSGPTISGPTGGAIIQDALAWGLKAPESPKAKDKEKKRTLWGFRDKAETAPMPSPAPTARSMLPSGSKPIFGMPLAEAVEIYSVRGVDISLPSVVYRCLEYLEAKGASNEEGIFRLSGSNLTIKALKDRFNQEGDVDFLAEDVYYDVHAIASLLKMYLRELPSSVLGPRELHMQFQSVLDLDDPDSKIAAYNVLVHRLPPANWTLIRSLSAFLIGVVSNSNINKMTVRNVGIVFSPTLNIPSPLFAAFLTSFDRIFTNEPPPISALSPVMEHPEPGTQQYRKHVLHDSRPPQSRDASVHRRSSRSRTRSRTPDRSTSAQSRTAYGRRPSEENVRQQISSSPQSRPSLSQTKSNSEGKISKDDMRSGMGLVRQRSEDRESITSSASSFAVPMEIRPGRDSIGPGLASTNIMRDAKARRRESSMLLMGGGTGAGQRKSGLPQMRTAVGM